VRRNRPASPNLFADELAAAFDIVGHAPHIGRLYQQSPVPDTRRALLKGTRYHVYYVRRADEVRVLAVWHAQRGVGPPLRASKASLSIIPIPWLACFNFIFLKITDFTGIRTG